MSAARSTPGIGLSGHGAISTRVLTWSEALSWSDCVDQRKACQRRGKPAEEERAGDTSVACAGVWTPRRVSPGDAAGEMRAASGGENGGNGRVTASDRAADGGRRAESDNGLSPFPFPHPCMHEELA